MTVAMRRLPWHRPLWRLTAITGSDDTPVALVVVFHPVLADGIRSLAVLARLVDSAATAAATDAGRAPVDPKNGASCSWWDAGEMSPEDKDADEDERGTDPAHGSRSGRVAALAR
jgi:hypothetical protein